MSDKKRELYTRKLEHGGTLRCRDVSRRIAADSWLVAVECRVTVPVPPDELINHEKDEEPWLAACIRNRLGDSLDFLVRREKHFVADPEKDNVLGELLARFLDNMLSYLDNPAFSPRLLEQRYGEFRKKCLEEQTLTKEDPKEEDNTPADFSAIFNKPA